MRIAANRLQLSAVDYINNAFLEVAEDGTVLYIAALQDLPAELHSTPFYNGIVVPFALSNLTLPLSLEYLYQEFFNSASPLTVGNRLSGISLLVGKNLFSHAIVDTVFQLK